MNFLEQFSKNVAEHKIKILKDDGLHRHIKLSRTDTMAMHFEILTWPGYLCYTGDMGTYVFRRTEDMFKFFRRLDKTYDINVSYWAEKVEAADKHDGITEFSFDKFKANVLVYLTSFEDEYAPGEEASDEEKQKYKAAFAELYEAINDEILSCDDNGVRAYDVATNFRHEGEAYQALMGEGSSFELTDFWEVDNTEFTHRFMWCCHAIEWAIDVYDKEKELSEIGA